MANRTYPHAWNYKISGAIGKGAASVPASTVAALCDAKLIDAPRPSLTTDFLLYHATDAGRAYAKCGDPSEADSQLDWTVTT